MINTIIVFVGLWLLEKSAEAILDKLLEKLLSDKNLNQLSNSLKLQILVLYLDWLLKKTPLRDLLPQLNQDLKPAQLEKPD